MENLIIIDPAVCNGRPVVRGTRITVQTVMEFLAAGDSVDDVLEAYPSLNREQVLVCEADGAGFEEAFANAHRFIPNGTRPPNLSVVLFPKSQGKFFSPENI